MDIMQELSIYHEQVISNYLKVVGTLICSFYKA